MAMVEFVGQSQQDSDNISANTSRLINCYREPAGGRTPHVVKSVLGEEAFADITDVFLRDMEEVGGKIFAACGGGLYRIGATGGIDTLGEITDGETVLSSNNGKVTIAAAGDYYVWDGTTLSEPATGSFSSVGSCTFLSQYTIITEKGGRRFSWSDVADPETIDALNFATKEGRDDDVLRAVAINGRLWLFGKTSAEIWYVTGQADANAFRRVTGGVIDTGLKAFGLLAEMDQGAFFVGDDNIAYVVDGSAPKPISSRAVETAISQGSPSRCFFYEDEGHKFCVIRFTDRPAWVFDIATGEWHERAKGVDLRPWDAVASVKMESDWYVGTDLGGVNKLTRRNADVGEPLLRRMVSNSLYMDGRRFRLAELEVFANMGRSDLSVDVTREAIIVNESREYVVNDEGAALAVDVDTTDGRAAKCWARFSRDGGNRWGETKERGLGKIGEYEARALWRAQGQYRQLTAELNCSEPSDINFHAQARVRIA